MIPDQNVMPRQCDNSEFTDSLNKDRYQVFTHKVQTDDGYILTVHNTKLSQTEFDKLPENKKANAKKPLLLISGANANSDTWFSRGEQHFNFNLSA